MRVVHEVVAVAGADPPRTAAGPRSSYPTLRPTAGFPCLADSARRRRSRRSSGRRPPPRPSAAKVPETICRQRLRRRPISPVRPRSPMPRSPGRTTPRMTSPIKCMRSHFARRSGSRSTAFRTRRSSSSSASPSTAADNASCNDSRVVSVILSLLSRNLSSRETRRSLRQPEPDRTGANDTLRRAPDPNRTDLAETTRRPLRPLRRSTHVRADMFVHGLPGAEDAGPHGTHRAIHHHRDLLIA